MFYHPRRFRFSFLILLGWVLALLLHSISIGILPGVAQPVSGRQLVQQGIEQYQSGNFAEAIAPWQQALSQTSEASERAVIHNNLAQAYHQIGQLDQAIAQWDQAIQIYQSLEDEASQQTLAQLLVEQAQAYSDLGQYRRAIPLLEEALEITQSYPSLRTEAAIQGSLGNAHSALGDYEAALPAYQSSLELARSLGDASYTATALNNLGNLYVRQAERHQYQANSAMLEGVRQEAERLTQLTEADLSAARQAYEQNWQISQTIGGTTEATALLNLNRFLEQSSAAGDREQIALNRTRIEELLSAAPDSRSKAYALLNLAKGLQNYPIDSQDLQRSQVLLEQALTVARNIGDRRAESFALGSLGEWEESANRYREALEWTRQAQFVAQQVGAAESLYRWQWQAGRLLNATGDKQRAIASYQQAIATLQGIRGDIVSANRDLQFNFRDSVEPVYRELMALLLETPTTANAGVETTADNQNDNVSKVLDILELLKLAEIQNFFGDDCVQVARARVETETPLSDPTAAIVYSVILNDHTEMIVRSTSGALTHYPVRLNAEDLQTEINQLRSFLEKRSTDEYFPHSQRVYDLLMRPLEADLAAIAPKTLVFVNDGVLRNVPMAALHDGHQFLVEKYAIATTPSLNLTAGSPLDRENMEALTLGLTVARPPFSALTNVEAEATEVQTILGGSKLLDEDFTTENLEEELRRRNYPIVHMATHGRFGVDAQSTFLLAFDQRLPIEQIDTLLRTRLGSSAVELLTLSACQTAAGDDRTALGIAGVAVRAGVKSALASLWDINDAATVPLIEAFYQKLRDPNFSKAEALRWAQLKMIQEPEYPEYSHPAIWSPFILVGNWL